MKKSLRILLGFCTLALVSFTINTVIDYLSVGTEVLFDKEKYNLAWSSHPNDTYFKQEYLRKGEKLERYEKMIMVEALKTNLDAAKVSLMKLNELNTLKKTNPIVSFKQLESSDKKNKMISFVISGGNILEWNLYKYEQQQVDNETMIVLYAYSYRNYISSKEEVTTFFEYIKTHEKAKIEILNKTAVPRIKLKK